ncbi:MAG: hypothetical protein ABFS45_20805, partial [Pseudomonadota bacterium]
KTEVKNKVRTMSSSDALTSSALVIAHPGHELFVYGWLKHATPRVFVLTDGSGRMGSPRIDNALRILKSLDAPIGEPFGLVPDEVLYRHILNREIDFFVQLTRNLATAFVRDGIQTVVGDSFERQFLAHDVCRLMIGAATEIAARQMNRPVRNFEIPMYGYFGGNTPLRGNDTLEIEFDEATVSEKMVAARSYEDPAFQHEVDYLLAQRGPDALRHETMWPVTNLDGYDVREKDAPAYEIHGQKLVDAGHHEQVIRFRDHVTPIADALLKLVERYRFDTSQHTMAHQA